MNDKMKTPLWTEQNINIRPLDYSKENYLATFTPQTQLTPEQIFWSKDVLKMKAKALKEQTKTSRPIKALTVYPPNTPAKLVPRITRAKHIEQTTALLTANENLKAQIHENMKCIPMDSVKPRVLAPGVNSCTDASRSKHRSNTKKNRISLAKSVNKKKVEEHPRTNNSSLKNTNRVDSSISSKRTVINLNSHSVCKTCNKCLISANHDMCVVNYLHSVNASPSVKNVVRKVRKVWKPKQVKQVWKATGKVLTNVGYQWKPTGRIFTLGEQCPLTRLTKSNVLHVQQTKNVSRTDGPLVFGLSCSKHMTRDLLWLKNFMKKFIEIVRFGNDHFGAIMGYGDYVIGDSVISRHSCYVRDTDGVDLIKGSRGSNLYTISVEDMMKSSPIYLLSKASKNKSWLWHRRLNHLNFGTINDLVRKDLVRGLPRLKFEKDHLCSACQLEKSKKHTHTPKTENTNLEVLNTLHMDLCGPMRVQTINGKKYILVIVDDYSRFTWVKFLRSKDETPEFVIKFLKQIQNDVVERRNRTLVEAARTMLIFSKALMFLWAEAVPTACYTENRSLIHTRHNKTPYEQVHDKKPDLTFLRVFSALCYLTNDSEDLQKLQPTAVIGIFVGYAPSRKGPAPTFLMPGQISSRLIPNPVLAAPYVPDFSAGTHSSTTIDQDAPSPSYSSSSLKLQPPISHQGVAVGSTIIEDNPFAHADNNPFINVFASKPSSEASSSGDASLAESTYVTQPHHHLGK
ncbi:retrovirus-related pol polyprotein from transposon TNT 1-94 [Tanacetum coccineum]